MFGSSLLFSATGNELWKVVDPNPGTDPVPFDIHPAGMHLANASQFTVMGSTLFFAADDGTHGFEPWALPKTAVGSSFADVTRAHWAWSQVEALAAAGITLGCAPERYCPAGTVTRPEMAIFLGRSIHGGSFVPPPAT